LNVVEIGQKLGLDERKIVITLEITSGSKTLNKSLKE